MPKRAESDKQAAEPKHKAPPLQPVNQALVVLQQQAAPGVLARRTAADPRTVRPADILALQRTVGNQAVSQLLQAKLTVGPVGDCYEQQADRVAEQVLRMPLPVSDPRAALSGYPPGSPVSGKAEGTGERIQRKIFVEGKEIKGKEKKKSQDFFTKFFSQFTKFSSKKKAPDVRGKMMKDKRCRYFESEDEVSRYIKGETENIGYLKKRDTWIRIDKNKLLVLGESHGEGDVNLWDIVKAVGTNKFMYEGFIGHPDQETKELSKAIRKKNRGYKSTFNIKDKKQLEYTKDTERFSIKDDEAFPHAGESFYTRMLTALARIDEGLNRQESEKKHSYNFITSHKLDLRFAILNAAGTTDNNDKKILKTYYAYQTIFDDTAEQLTTMDSDETSLGKKIKSGSYDLWTGFYEDFTKYAKKKTKQEKEKMGDQEKKRLETWKKKWKPVFKPSDDESIREAEKERDISMYHHIKTAKEKGYLLYGCGDLHRLRLADVLEEENIQHQSMKDFIKTQQWRHPDLSTPKRDREFTSEVYERCLDDAAEISDKFKKKGWKITFSGYTIDVVEIDGKKKMAQKDIREFLKKNCNYHEKKTIRSGTTEV